MLIRFGQYGKLIAVNEMKINDKVDVRALNKVRKCFTQIITNYGFFADLLFNLKIMECPHSEVPTMATDGISIGYSAQFVHELTEPQVMFVLIHEVMHNANFHFDRQGIRDHELWNQAADYAINVQIDDMRKDMKQNRLDPPKGILLDDKYRGMSAEQIYDILEKEGGKCKKPNQPGQGQGALPGDIRQPGSLSGEEIYKAEPGEGGQGNDEINDAKNVDQLKKVWQDIRNNAASKNAGSGSASLDRWLRKVNRPKINWRAELTKFIAQIFDELDYAYSNKRYIWQDMHLPGPHAADKSTYENVVIAIDTSGSITDDTLGKFASEMLKLFKMYSIKKCHIIWCDSEISSVQTFDVDSSFKIDRLKPTGGGGTSFKPPFEWVEKNIIKKGKVPAFFIYFTDAYGEAPSTSQYRLRTYMNRVLWVITENDSADNIKFGKKIFIDKLPG